MASTNSPDSNAITARTDLLYDYEDEDPYIDQATNLPADVDERIDGFPKLKGSEDFNYWTSMVSRRFRDLGLKHLLDLDLPYPEKQDPMYDAWRKLSMRMRMWLALHVDKDILELIDVTVPSIDKHELEFADAFYYAVLNIILTPKPILQLNVFLSAVRTQQSEFSTLLELIPQFMKWVTCSNRLGMPITPYTATALLLSQLQNELPTFVEVKKSEISGKERDMAHEEFLEICIDAIDRARKLGFPIDAASSTKKRNLADHEDT